MASITKEFIEQLHKGQEAILHSLSSLQQVARDFLQAQRILLDLDQQLFSHWGKYHEFFFEQVVASQAGNREALKMIEFFKHDIKDVKIQYITFSDKYRGHPNPVIISNFPKDFDVIRGVLINHINMEAEYFFPILEKIIVP